MMNTPNHEKLMKFNKNIELEKVSKIFLSVTKYMNITCFFDKKFYED